MNRYGSSFLLTLFLYTIVIVSVVFSNSNIQNIQTAPPKQTTNLKVKIVTTQEKKVEKKVIKKELPKKKPIIKPIEKTKPKHIKKKAIKPKKVLEEPEKVEKKRKEKTTPKPQSSQKIVKQKPLAKIDETLNENKINKQKQLYFSQIKQTIDKNKTYPRIAVRRAIEGSVKVKFTLTQYGDLVSFTILEGQRIFKKSIAKAIKKSFPISPPKNIFKENIDLFVTLNYELY